MNALELKNYGVSDLKVNELYKTEGGWIVPFVAGAIAGGLLYDAWKEGIRITYRYYCNNPMPPRR